MIRAGSGPGQGAPSAAAAASSWLSPANAELFHRLTEYGKQAVQYGWIPFILLLGYTTSDPKPDLMRILNPLS